VVGGDTNAIKIRDFHVSIRLTLTPGYPLICADFSQLLVIGIKIPCT